MEPEEQSSELKEQSPSGVPKGEAGKRKIADHPNWWTLVLSGAALIVSGLSYKDSHYIRTLNTELNRPIVRVTSIREVAIVPIANPSADKQPRTYSFTVRNSGRTYAKNVRVSYRVQLNDLRVGLPNLARFSDFGGSTEDTEQIGSLAPDDEFEGAFMALTPTHPPTLKLGTENIGTVSQYAKGTLSYSNPITSEEYSEPFCFYQAGLLGRFQRCPENDKVNLLKEKK